MDVERKAVLRELRRIPGVGASISEDLWNLGIRAVSDLRGRDPGEMYERLCGIQGVRVDPCMLYVFRCAVYFASRDDHDPELLKWWSWKDRRSGWSA
ncbi:MAG TPA: helix-hairpin-helix domain-containing protein [Longimicrobium sp.]|nr:helix-hairpin-helix domain-containing protein [Longimicrobium sp.]